MKWHDHPLQWKALAEMSQNIKGTPEECVEKLSDKLRQVGHNRMAETNTIATINGELKWQRADRPYYDLYPGIAEAFVSVDLDKIDCTQVKLPLPQLLIRLPVGQEIQTSPTSRLRSLLVYESMMNYNHDRRGWLLSINDGSVKREMHFSFPVHTISAFALNPGETLGHRLHFASVDNYCDDVIDQKLVETAVRIVVTLCLLRANPDLIEPLPLEADKAKWEAAHPEQRVKLLEKAARRGKRGWAIGKHIEVAPGFRRPHFAIRWMGKGRTEPVLRPIRGCLVRRQAITEVPTDWLGPDLEVVGGMANAQP